MLDKIGRQPAQQLLVQSGLSPRELPLFFERPGEQFLPIPIDHVPGEVRIVGRGHPIGQRFPRVFPAHFHGLKRNFTRRGAVFRHGAHAADNRPPLAVFHPADVVEAGGDAVEVFPPPLRLGAIVTGDAAQIQPQKELAGGFGHHLGRTIDVTKGGRPAGAQIPLGGQQFANDQRGGLVAMQLTGQPLVKPFDVRLAQRLAVQ